ncbi:glycerophosphoryl diester phosphodiesterase [Murinocardiopsis flavida]|uniref:Glycerophosphoryl diester phosphodiesterase n=1 Tax=Murinocardiopsis flavida TaxID=645275 RepID=A0A2P8DHB7_9ACTN|nr:glycerophosphodiester phosphodiesterase family protein [Murinocardiopsis flavida]PSK96604.1 glycerophosphoryl diester phosphodiesterase [Murinocardiopsis flavida]
MFRRTGPTVAAVTWTLVAGAGIADALPADIPHVLPPPTTTVAAAAPAPSAPEFPRAVPDGAASGIVEVAHRGASGYAPENTLAAVDEAAARGATTVEVDVQRTKDGRLVLIHDRTLERTTDAKDRFPDRSSYAVDGFTYAELRTLDAGSWFGAEFKGERIPSLEEGVDRMRAKGLNLLLELKSPERHPGIAKDVASVFQSRQWWLWPSPEGERPRLVVQSFDHGALKSLHTLLPRVPIGLLGRVPERDLDAYAKWADQINPKHTKVDADYVAAVHERGMEVFVFTVDKPAEVRSAVESGVDGVISNLPDTVRADIRTAEADTAKRSAAPPTADRTSAMGAP